MGCVHDRVTLVKRYRARNGRSHRDDHDSDTPRQTIMLRGLEAHVTNEDLLEKFSQMGFHLPPVRLSLRCAKKAEDSPRTCARGFF